MCDIMAAYTTGELKNGQYRDEATWGTMQTGAMTMMGKTRIARPMHDDKHEFVPFAGTRSNFSLNHGPWDKGIYSKIVPLASNWKNFFLYYGWGSASGVAEHLDSFTAQFDVYNGTTHAYQLLNGCKMNKLEIIGVGPGKMFEFDFEAYSQYAWQQSSKTVSNIQNITLGADGSDPGTSEVIWNGNAQINLGGGGLSTFYPQNFKLIVDNKLFREPGIKEAYDGSKYPVAIALHEGVRDIIFEATVISQNQTYHDAMRLKTAVTALTFPIDGETITLSNGHFMPTYPEYKQEINTEQIRIKFTDVSIA